jgi:hypothetical protein
MFLAQDGTADRSVLDTGITSCNSQTGHTIEPLYLVYSTYEHRQIGVEIMTREFLSLLNIFTVLLVPVLQR